MQGVLPPQSVVSKKRVDKRAIDRFFQFDMCPCPCQRSRSLILIIFCSWRQSHEKSVVDSCRSHPHPDDFPSPCGAKPFRYCHPDRRSLRPGGRRRGQAVDSLSAFRCAASDLGYQSQRRFCLFRGIYRSPFRHRDSLRRVAERGEKPDAHLLLCGGTPGNSPDRPADRRTRLESGRLCRISATHQPRSPRWRGKETGGIDYRKEKNRPGKGQGHL